jgi:hypothetical protein|tara:strand:+ start:80554 stop:80874 length:321 start_codon:yes stop_codon:yes gene_type:complete
MASGRLGKADLVATTDTVVYTCPADTFTVATVSICNRGNQVITLKMSVSDSGTPDASEYVEYDTEVLSHGVLERTGLVMNAGQKLVVWSNAVNVSAVVMGIETGTS